MPGRGISKSALIAVCAAAIIAPLAHGDSPPGRIGPALSQTANGRVLHPAGRMTTVGDFPTGGTLSPDGRFYWAVDAGHGRDDVQIVDVATGTVTQVLPLPGAYVGVAFAPDGRSAYVSGEPIGDSKPTGPTKGDAGDVVHVFSVDPGGHATELNPIAIPRVSGGQAQQHAQSLIPGYPTPGPGASVALDWPEGLAVTPDGAHLVVALNQADQVAVADLRSGAVQTVKVGAYPEGVAIDRSGRFAYVTNELDGTVSVLDIGALQVVATIPVGGPSGGYMAHPEGIVADQHRDRVYVAVASRDAIAFVDTTSRTVSRYVSVAEPEGVGSQPIALAISPDDRTLYSADSGEDAVAAISLGTRPALLAHHAVAVPSAAAIRRHYRRTHHLLRGRVISACAGPNGRQARAYERAVVGSRGRRPAQLRARLGRLRARLPRIRSCNDGTLHGLPEGRLIGRIPTAAYPSAVAVTPDGSRLIWLSAEGLGAGPNPGYGSHFANSDAATYGTYVIDMLLGRVGVLDRPTDMQVQALNAVAQADRMPPQPAPPPSTPVVGPDGGPSRQIKHVFYIVKENRTYDQLFGTDPRGDGDPALELFDDNGVKSPAGGVTPNAHALTRMFPLLDHFYADSEVSVDGHIVTAGAYAIDYVEKALHPNYSGRGRVDEFGSYPISYPPNYFIFDQAVKQGVSFINYGEHAGTLSPDSRPGYNQVQSNSPISYPFDFGCDGLLPVPNNDVTRQANCNSDSGTLGTGGVDIERSRFDYFQANFDEQLARNRVPALNYITLPNDHTNGAEVGAYTPRALVADNDLGLGQFVDLISHSPIWSSSAIFVVEDDSQDGADHVDAHRMPAYVISPWARHGTVVHTRYDQLSVLRTIELILGLKPLSLFDGTATPMYDAFMSGSQRADATPYTAITPQQSLTETNSAQAAARAAGPLASAMPWNTLDAVPQEIFDRVLYHDVYGPSYSPPPGPNASPLEAARAQGALELLPRGIAATRAWLEQTASPTGAGADG